MSFTPLYAKNNAEGTLLEDHSTYLTLSGTSSIDDSLPIASQEPFNITVDQEIMTVTQVDETSSSHKILYVTRGQEGTTSIFHDPGVAVKLNITANCINNINTAVNDIYTGDATVGGIHSTGNAIIDTAFVGKITTGYAYFGYSSIGATDFAVRQNSTKLETSLNAMTGGQLVFKIGGSTKAYFDSTGNLTISNNAIISGTLNVTSTLTCGSLNFSGDLTINSGNLSSGIQGTTPGNLKVYGDNSTIGGYISLYNGNSVDTYTDYWKLYTDLTGNFVISSISDSTVNTKIIEFNNSSFDVNIYKDVDLSGSLNINTKLLLNSDSTSIFLRNTNTTAIANSGLLQLDTGVTYINSQTNTNLYIRPGGTDLYGTTFYGNTGNVLFPSAINVTGESTLSSNVYILGTSNFNNIVISGSSQTRTFNIGSNYLQFNADTGRNYIFRVNSTSVVSISSSGLLPGVNNTYALGSSSLKWSSIYATYSSFGTVDVTGATTIGTNISYGGIFRASSTGVNKDWSKWISASEFYVLPDNVDVSRHTIDINSNTFETIQISTMGNYFTSAYFSLPPDYDGTSSLKYEIFWTVDSSAASGTITWSLKDGCNSDNNTLALGSSFTISDTILGYHKCHVCSTTRVPYAAVNENLLLLNLTLLAGTYSGYNVCLMGIRVSYA